MRRLVNAPSVWHRVSVSYLQLEYEQLHACQLSRRQHQTRECIADAELGLRNGVCIGVIVVLLALKYCWFDF